MFPSTMWGNQTETQRWTLEVKPKGFRCSDQPIQAKDKGCTLTKNNNKAQQTLNYLGQWSFMVLQEEQILLQQGKIILKVQYSVIKQIQESVHFWKSLSVLFRRVYDTFSHHYINMREEFYCYKYIISFNSKTRSKD